VLNSTPGRTLATHRPQAGTGALDLGSAPWPLYRRMHARIIGCNMAGVKSRGIRNGLFRRWAANTPAQAIAPVLAAALDVEMYVRQVVAVEPSFDLRSLLFSLLQAMESRAQVK
jgi:hypothetical protein